jgi:hypothetical protein
MNEDDWKIVEERSKIIEDEIKKARELKKEDKNVDLNNNSDIIKEILRMKDENKINIEFDKYIADKSLPVATMNTNGFFFTWTKSFKVNFFNFIKLF